MFEDDVEVCVALVEWKGGVRGVQEEVEEC